MGRVPLFVTRVARTLDAKTGLLTGLLAGASRETGLEMPCCPANDLLWVQITQSYPNRLRFSRLPCPQSPCHSVIDPVFKEGFLPGKNFFSDQALRRDKQGTKDGGWRNVPHTLCRLFQTCRRIGVYLSSEEHLHRSLTRQGLQDMQTPATYPECVFCATHRVQNHNQHRVTRIEPVYCQYRPQYAPRCNVIRSPCL